MVSCNVAKDLFVPYVSGLASEETRALVDEHICQCADCQTKLTDMQNRVAVQLREPDATKINVFKTMKKKILRRNVFIGVVTAVVALVVALFVGVQVVGYKPIPYYDGLVKAEVRYTVAYNDGHTSVVAAEGYEIAESQADSFVITDANGVKRTLVKMPILDLICSREYSSVHATGRIVERDGERVNVQYVCYLANRLDQGEGEAESTTFRLWHENSPADERVRTEVYYLTDVESVRNANSLSDDGFDAYRNEGTLIWSGVVE